MNIRKVNRVVCEVAVFFAACAGAAAQTGVLTTTIRADGRVVLRATKPEVEVSLGLPGQVRDSETGTFYNGQRDAYDPLSGRYRQPDPLGIPAGLNRFVYAGADPLRYTDPTGQYIPGAHNSLSFTQAQGTCLHNQAAALGKLTGDVDSELGSQDPQNAFMHSMCAPGEPMESCGPRIAEYVLAQMNQCTLKGLARALHAVQDSYAPGHANGRQWKGMPWQKGGETWLTAAAHFAGDVVPLSSKPAAATRKLIEEYCKRCLSCPNEK